MDISFSHGPTAQEQARADAARKVQKEIDAATGRYWDGDTLTAAGVDYLTRHQKAPPKNARADAVSQGDGLVMTTRLDASNRPIHEFRSIDGKKHWMAPYRAVPALQVALTNNVENTRRQGQRYLNEHPGAELL